MISAKEALKYERAQLSSEDVDKIRVLETKIDSIIAETFARRPLGIPIPATDLTPTMIGEITRIYRRGGWAVGWEPLVEQSALTKKPMVAGYKLVLDPSNEAYDDSKVIL